MGTSRRGFLKRALGAVGVCIGAGRLRMERDKIFDADSVVWETSPIEATGVWQQMRAKFVLLHKGKRVPGTEKEMVGTMLSNMEGEVIFEFPDYKLEQVHVTADGIEMTEPVLVDGLSIRWMFGAEYSALNGGDFTVTGLRGDIT